MTERTVTHATFTLEHTYDAPPVDRVVVVARAGGRTAR
jgi:hypothetical protein